MSEASSPTGLLTAAIFAAQGGHVKYADVFGRDALGGEFPAGVDGGQVHALLQGQDVVQQGGEAHLDEPHDGRAESGYERAQEGVLLHVFLGGFRQDAVGLRRLDDVGEAHVVQLGENLVLGHVLGELSEEHGGEDDHPVAVLEYPAEVVLSHVDGAAGARFQAHPAVHAGVFVDGGLPVPHPDGLRRAQAHAVRASDAGLGVHF